MGSLQNDTPEREGLHKKMSKSRKVKVKNKKLLREERGRWAVPVQYCLTQNVPMLLDRPLYARRWI